MTDKLQRDWDANDWRCECVFIDRCADRKGRTRQFNRSTSCFIRYCEMQRDTAERAGFYDAATHIQHVIDDMKGYT